MRNKALIFAFALTPLGAMAQNPAPLSAIDWLYGQNPVHLGIAEPIIDENIITQTQLPALNMDAAGILPQQLTGFPPDLWEESRAATLINQIETLGAPKLPALQQLYTTLLLAEARAPHSQMENGAFLHARLSALANIGAMEPAVGLANLPATATPSLQNLRLELALWQDPLGAECPDRPSIWADYAAQIFCAARAGDWDEAQLIYAAAKGLQLVDQDRFELLAAFLDIAPLGQRPSTPTSLDAAIALAAGAPYNHGALPLPFAYADLDGTNGWKAAINAAERLVAAGAIDPNRLWGIYDLQTPSATGGIWDRVYDFAKFRKSLGDSDLKAVEESLNAIWPAMRGEGLEFAFAQSFAPQLIRLPYQGPPPEIVAKVIIASGTALPEIWAMQVPQLAFEQAVASGRVVWATPQTALQERIKQGFINALPNAQSARIAQGKFGEAILKAIADVEKGALDGSETLSDGLASLRLLGLGHVARAAAVEILLRGSL